MIPLQTQITEAADTVAAVTPKEKVDWELIKTLPVDDLIQQLAQRIVHFAIQVAIAIAVFYIGKFIIRKLISLVSNILERRKVDASLRTFLMSLVQIVLYFILIVTVIGILGIETSSFIAIFASAGVAIGMALSGTLQNFASGVLILLLKPYKVGDYIETQGFAGTVTEIQIFSTIINTYDNKTIILPNGGLATGSINNWNREDYRRVDWTVSISYGDSFQTASDAILAILRSEPDVVQQYIEDDRAERRLKAGLSAEADEEDGACDPATDPDCQPKRRSWWKRLFGKSEEKVLARINERREARAAAAAQTPKTDRSPSVVLSELADSAVVVKARAWVPTVSYWNVFYTVNRRIYEELPKAGINFPFPQMDVHLDKE